MKYKVLLWDIDATILNFKKAEATAIRKGFVRLELGECTDEMLQDYMVINRRYWKALELGEMTKEAILVERFKEFFAKYSLDVTKANSFNENYQVDLGDTIVFNDNAYEILQTIDKKIAQYCVTNGTQVAQQKKIEKANLRAVMKGFFISDEIGFEKPSKEFFEPVFREIREKYGDVSKEEIIIIGDSLTSDMQGGNNVGIKCCWYNPDKLPKNQSLKIDYEITNLSQVLDIIKE